MSQLDERVAAPAWRARLIALGVALAATMLAWVVADLAGVELRASQPGQDAVPIGLVNVAASVVLFGGLGWLARVILDRFAKRRAVLIWRIGAGAVFLLEVFPVILTEATVGTKVFLAILHVIVAVVLIPVLGRRLPEA
ncbi:MULTISPECIES: DUF6069 family protein [Glycomyces]|uniref:DUF6069 family protein n=1 Tax=Glycomyces lechevalierae TaxID=256034 RepID=A0A9X3SX18_9ACTN|nr:DUF6069 family protein [Glycomyces lechevalierae]MDA1384646.1 DUF6069 family protein [Glycomyces lechevalierae]MDR7337901.1 hypothetical protein [Glycomyces lechevalierae]